MVLPGYVYVPDSPRFDLYMSLSLLVHFALLLLQSVEDVRPLLRDKYKLHELIEAAIPPPAATAPMCYQPSV